MLGGLSNVSSQLSQLYNSNSEQLASSLTKIASGKRINTASDDFAGFIRASALKDDIAGYESARKDLAGAKSIADYAVATGSTVVDGLTKLKTLAQQYAGTSDTNEQAALQAEFDSAQTALGVTIAQAQYDGTAVYTAAALTSVDLGPSSEAGTLSFTTTTVADEGNADITDVTTIDDEITAAATYLSEAQAFSSQVGDFQDLTSTVIDSKTSEISAIEDVDDMAEMSKITDLQIRQQAAVSMMSQANMSRMGIMQLFS